MTPTPLLGLALIVKNEAHGLAKTLRSFKNVIDTWTVYDTGSTDGTQDLVRAELASVPGRLVEGPFGDFSTARNLCLDLHADGPHKTAWTFMPDADDILVNGFDLRAWLTKLTVETTPVPEAILVNLVRGNLDYYLPLLMRTSARKRYKGRVHEHLDYVATVRLPHVKLTQEIQPQSAEATKRRWERDLHLLAADVAANPKDPRALFYLAQTHECLGNHITALEVYHRRVAAGGWRDETFEAKRRIAALEKKLRDDDLWIISALDAYIIDPRRAETIYEIAEHYRMKDNHALAYLYGSRAACLPKPETTMFVDPDVYRYKAADVAAISGYYLAKQTGDIGTFASGKMFAEKCVAACPQDNRMRATRAFYAPKVTELLQGFAHIRPVQYTPEPGFHNGNCSVHYNPFDRQWRCLLRTTNYKIVNGEYLTPDGKGGLKNAADSVIYTKNVMLELAADMTTRDAFPILDETKIAATDFPVHGYEDCRLFSIGNALYASATVCDWPDAPAGNGQRELVMLRIDGPNPHGSNDYAFTEAKRLPVWDQVKREAQKNWMPVQWAWGPSERAPRDLAQAMSMTDFVYSTVPLSRTSDALPPDTIGRLRGGSQVIPITGRGHQDMRLAIVHDVCWPGGPSRIYLHRFVAFDMAMTKVIGMSEPFYFEKLGIEFCAGLAIGPGPWGDDGKGEQIVASFSVDDSAAYFAVFDLHHLLEYMFHAKKWVV